jgi:hypothetical protein
MATKQAAQAKEENLYDGNHFIISEKKIDKFTTKRNRIVLTPAVCDICGLDLIENIGGETPYREMTSAEKEVVEKAVQKHKELVHTSHAKLIVTGDQVPTSYLGEPKQKRK